MASYTEVVIDRIMEGKERLPPNKELDAKVLMSYWVSHLYRRLKKENIQAVFSPVKAHYAARLGLWVYARAISEEKAHEIFDEMFKTEAGRDYIKIIHREILIAHEIAQTPVPHCEETDRFVDSVLAEHPEQVAEYKAGKDRLFGFFVGQVMKASKGKALAKQANETLKKRLTEGEER